MMQSPPRVLVIDDDQWFAELQLAAVAAGLVWCPSMRPMYWLAWQRSTRRVPAVDYPRYVHAWG